HGMRPSIQQDFGALGLGQESTNLPTGLLRSGALDKVRSENSKGIPVVAADDRFDFGIRHEGYYGKEWWTGSAMCRRHRCTYTSRVPWSRKPSASCSLRSRPARSRLPPPTPISRVS